MVVSFADLDFVCVVCCDCVSWLCFWSYVCGGVMWLCVCGPAFEAGV